MRYTLLIATAQSFLFAVSAEAGDRNAVDLAAITARLNRLQHLKVDYDITYHTTSAVLDPGLPPGGLKSGQFLDVSLPDGYGMRVSLTYVDGQAKWESVLSESAVKWAERYGLQQSRSSQTSDHGISQELAHTRHGPAGSISPGEPRNRWWAVELALGIWVSGGRTDSSWVQPASLSRMQLDSSDPQLVLLRSELGSNRQVGEWTFDRSRGYAIIRWRRMLGPSLRSEVVPSDFREVDGLVLPFAVSMKSFDSTGKASPISYTATILQYQVGGELEPKLTYPKNTILTDNRTRVTYTVEKDGQVVNDAVLAQAMSGSPADENAPLRIRGTRQALPQAQATPTRMKYAAWTVGAIFVLLIIYFGARRLRRRLLSSGRRN